MLCCFSLRLAPCPNLHKTASQRNSEHACVKTTGYPQLIVRSVNHSAMDILRENVSGSHIWRPRKCLRIVIIRIDGAGPTQKKT